MEIEDLNEMLIAAINAKESGFPRIEIDPAHMIEVLNMAITAKRSGIRYSEG